MNYTQYLIEAKNKKISEHFTLFDICNSQNAINHNINNTPDQEVINNATIVINKILEPTRMHFNQPLKVNCIFRCPALNKIDGGVPTSQHLEGKAVDFTLLNVTLQEIVDYIRHNLDFDQLILESTWVHCSYNQGKNRKEVLKNIDGKYISI